MNKSNPLFDRLIVIDDPTPRCGAINMAIDEILLNWAQPAILRFYRWKEPSVSFGYFVRFSEAVGAARDRATVRRWTGGGIVPHGEDLTYSIMIGSDDNAFSLASKIIYQRVHAALSSALRELGIATVLTDTGEPKLSEACFANPVVSDVMENGRKIAGAAHRKTRVGLLHQGSIQRQNVAHEFQHIFGELLGNTLIYSSIETDALDDAKELARKKYVTEQWLKRR